MALDLDLDAEGSWGGVSLVMHGEMEVPSHELSGLWVAVTSWRPGQAFPQPGSTLSHPQPHLTSVSLRAGNTPLQPPVALAGWNLTLAPHSSSPFTPFLPRLLHALQEFACPCIHARMLPAWVEGISFAFFQIRTKFNGNLLETKFHSLGLVPPAQVPFPHCPLTLRVLAACSHPSLVIHICIASELKADLYPYAPALPGHL